MKDKNVLVYSTRAVSAKQSQSLFEEMLVLKEFAENIEYMRFTKTSASFKKVQEMSQLKNLKEANFSYFDFYINEVASRKLTDWDDIIDKIDISHLKQYDRFYVWGGIINSVCGNRPKTIKTIKEFPYYLSKVWTSLGVQYIHIAAILKAHREFNIPITEIMHDPQEASLSLIETPRYKVNKDLYDLKFNYSIKSLGVEKFDFMQYFLRNERNTDLSRLFNVNLQPYKQYDFTFGYTVVTPDRNINDDGLLKLIHDKFNNPNIFVKHKFKEINTFVSREEYIDYIKKSKYTLIIPSYDIKHVSIIRIIEAVHNNCIPLFTEDNNFEALLESFPDFNYKDYIIDNNWTKFTDEEYNSKLLHCKDVFLEIKDLTIKGL